MVLLNQYCGFQCLTGGIVCLKRAMANNWSIIKIMATGCKLYLVLCASIVSQNRCNYCFVGILHKQKVKANNAVDYFHMIFSCANMYRIEMSQIFS